MGLTDEVAQHVLGRLFEVTKAIDAQEGRILQAREAMVAVVDAMNEADKKISQSLDATEAVHKAHIADVLAASMKQIEAASASASQAATADVVKNAEAVKVKLLRTMGDEVVSIVRERISTENTALAESSAIFKTLASEFKKSVQSSMAEAQRAVGNYDKELQVSIKKVPVYGWFGQAMMPFLVGAAGALLAGFLMAKGVIHLPGVSLSAQQVHEQQLGASLENKFSKFTEKEQERINAVLSSK